MMKLLAIGLVALGLSMSPAYAAHEHGGFHGGGGFHGHMMGGFDRHFDDHDYYRHGGRGVRWFYGCPVVWQVTGFCYGPYEY